MQRVHHRLSGRSLPFPVRMGGAGAELVMLQILSLVAFARYEDEEDAPENLLIDFG